MEVKGKYGRASSTVGGGLYGRPPPLALCQLLLAWFDMMHAPGFGSRTHGKVVELQYARGDEAGRGSRMGDMATAAGGSALW